MFQKMLATMMFLLEANEAHTIKQWDGLLSNVMGYIFIQKDAAAPAASYDECVNSKTAENFWKNKLVTICF
jgi:hypothetical protein